MIFFLIVFLLLLFFYYRLLEQKENQLIRSFGNYFGVYSKSVYLSFFSINGRNKLNWGLKLYLYNNGIIISNLYSKPQRILIAFEDIKGFNINGQFMSFYCQAKGLPSPAKLELSGGPFDKNLAFFINQKVLSH